MSSHIKEDWRELFRLSGVPAPAVGSMVAGMERDGDGQWIVIQAPVEAVELLEVEPNGNRIYRVLLGQSVPVEPRDVQCQ